MSMLKPLCESQQTGKLIKRMEDQIYLPPEKPVCKSRMRHGAMNWFQIGKGVCQSCELSLC